MAMIPSGPITLAPLHCELNWTWPIPGSKSLTNRALPLSALAPGSSHLQGVLHSDDTRVMRHCLGQLGIVIDEDADGSLRVEGGIHHLHAPSEELWVGNSGTTVRFLSALAALVPGSTTLRGDADMARRPIADLVEAMTQLGIGVECANGCPPLTVTGSSGIQGSASIPGHRSSQYASALLIAAAAGEAGLQLQITGDLVSRPYIAMTLAMIQAFGGQVSASEQNFSVSGPLQPATIAIEPDASAASYAFAAAVAGRGSITVQNLGTNSLQGDVAFVDILEQMGAKVERQPNAISVHAGHGIRGIEVDMHHISDTVMTLAAIAPLASSPTTIRNVANIRIKECDRLMATVTELRRLGQKVEHGEDWLRITPERLQPATVKTYHDHRIAMSFAILGLARSGISIDDPVCVAKTYPDFWQHLETLYRDHNQECPWADCAL